MRQRASRASLVSCGISGGLAVLLLGAPLLFGVIYYGFDQTMIDLGTMCAVRRALSDGDSLLLSPLLGNGTPLLARPSAQLLYPPRWLALLLPVDLGASLFMVLHLAAGAAATSWLLRTFGVRPLAAVCAGLAFVFSGPALDLLVHTGYFVLGATYLPLVWAASRRALQPRGRGGHVAVVGCAGVALMLGGEPQAFGLSVAIIAVEVGRRALRRRLPGRRSLSLLGALLSSLAVGAVLWGGFWGEAGISTRAFGLRLVDVLRWSFESAQWPALVLPAAVPREALPHAHVSLWSLVHEGLAAAHTWDARPYLGPLLLTGAVCGATLRRARVPSLVAAVGLLFSLGSATPVLPVVIKVVPVVGLFRYPQKYLVVTALAAVVVAAIWFDAMPRVRRLRLRSLWAGGTAVGALLLGLGAVVLWSSHLDSVWRELQHEPFFAQLPALSAILRRSLLQAALPIAAAVGLVACGVRWARFAVVLVAVDLLLAAPTAVQLGPPLSDLPSPLPGSSGTSRRDGPILCVNWLVFEQQLSGSHGAPGWNNMAMARIYRAPELQACDGAIGAVPYSSLWSSLTRSLTGLLFVNRTEVARALGCTHMLVLKIPAGGECAALPFYDDRADVRRLLARGPRLCLVSQPMPEVFVARAGRLTGSEVDVVERILATHDLAGVLAVADDPLGRLPAGAQLPDGSGAGEASVVWERSDRAVVQIAGAGAAVAGLRTAFLVGWRASQGERNLPVIRVAGQHVAAVVEEVSRGPVVFEYRIPYWTLCLAVSVVGGVGLGVSAVLARPRRRGRDPTVTGEA